MKTNERSCIQEKFLNSNDMIVVATIAFGLGIDKSNIRNIYHYNIAKSLEGYSHEIGRAGRDKNDSVCHTILCMDDIPMLESYA